MGAERPFRQPVKCGASRIATDNPDVEPRAVVREFWSRIQARDWDGLAELLASDVVLEWPNELVRIRGRANVVEFNRTYPEGWSIEVLSLVAEGSTVVSEVRVPHPTAGPYYALTFLEVEDGLVTRGREYWVEERYEEPPPARAHLFEDMRP
jgi:ketosteroid isomerase-like protein